MSRNLQLQKNKYFTIQGTIPMVKEINHENRAIIPKETVAVTHEKKIVNVLLTIRPPSY